MYLCMLLNVFIHNIISRNSVMLMQISVAIGKFWLGQVESFYSSDFSKLTKHNHIRRESFWHTLFNQTWFYTIESLNVLWIPGSRALNENYRSNKKSKLWHHIWFNRSWITRDILWTFLLHSRIMDLIEKKLFLKFQTASGQPEIIIFFLTIVQLYN